MISEDFLDDLISSIEKTAMDNISTPSKSYKPSSLHCIRNMYFQMEGREPEKNFQAYTSVGILEAGTDRHERIQAAIKEMRHNGFDCDYLDVPTYLSEHPELEDLEVIRSMGAETLLYNKKYNMRFACDGLINYKGKYYIIEFKTEGSYKFDFRNGVDPNHINQASAYSLSFNLNDVIFVYIDRNTLRMKCYLLEVTDTMRERIMSKIELCDSYVRREVIPPKDNVDYKICSWCQYKQYCKSLPKEEFTLEMLSS